MDIFPEFDHLMIYTKTETQWEHCAGTTRSWFIFSEKAERGNVRDIAVTARGKRMLARSPSNCWARLIA